MKIGLYEKSQLASKNERMNEQTNERTRPMAGVIRTVSTFTARINEGRKCSKWRSGKRVSLSVCSQAISVVSEVLSVSQCSIWPDNWARRNKTSLTLSPDTERLHQVLNLFQHAGSCHKIAAFHNIRNPTTDPVCIIIHRPRRWLHKGDRPHGQKVVGAMPPGGPTGILLCTIKFTNVSCQWQKLRRFQRKMHQKRSTAGLCPHPLEELTALPQSPSWI